MKILFAPPITNGMDDWLKERVQRALDELNLGPVEAVEQIRGTAIMVPYKPGGVHAIRFENADQGLNLIRKSQYVRIDGPTRSYDFRVIGYDAGKFAMVK